MVLLVAILATAVLTYLLTRQEGPARTGHEPPREESPDVPFRRAASPEPVLREQAPASTASRLGDSPAAAPVESPTPAPLPAGRLTGAVADPHGASVEGLALHWRTGRLVVASGATDSFGAFHLSGLPCGPGELVLGDLTSPVAPPVRIDLGTGRTDLGTLEVPELGRLTLQVLDEAGIPVAGAALTGEGDHGGSVAATSGLDGQAQAAHLPRGMYRVFAAHPESGRGNTVFEFTPGDAQPVEVRLRRSSPRD